MRNAPMQEAVNRRAKPKPIPLRVFFLRNARVLINFAPYYSIPRILVNAYATSDEADQWQVGLPSFRDDTCRYETIWLAIPKNGKAVSLSCTGRGRA